LLLYTGEGSQSSLTFNFSSSDPELSKDLAGFSFSKGRRREGSHCFSGIVVFLS